MGARVVECYAARRRNPDLPLKFHPTAMRASAVFDKPIGAVGATGGNAKLPHRVALEPVVAMIPANAAGVWYTGDECGRKCSRRQ